MLEALSKKDAYWRKIALRITKGDKDMADEIVQEMYIRRYDNNRDQEINEAYIAMTLKSIYMNKITNKDRKRFIFVGENNKLELFTQSSDDMYRITDEDQVIINRFNELSFTEKELVQLSYESSLRDIEKEYGINYGYVHKIITNARKRVLKKDFDNKYNNKRLKYKRMSRAIGLGDTIEKITKALGIDKVIEMSGKDCGCEKRKEYLNKVFAYKLKPRCMTDEELVEYTEFVKNRGFSLKNQSTGKGTVSPTDINYIIGLYNSIFSVNVPIPKCRSCSGTGKAIIKFCYNLDIVYLNNLPPNVKRENIKLVDKNDLQVKKS